MKKKILTAVIIMLLSLNVMPICAAAEKIIPAAVSEGIVSPTAEQTVWYNRVYNGKLQKRLWSITYQKWLTDWIDVE